jgi:hypothetical protein
MTPFLAWWAYAISIVGVGLEVLVLSKTLRISKREPLLSFAVLIAVTIVSETVLYFTPYHTMRYFRRYVAAECIRILISGWVVLTIFRSVFRHYPGIAQMSGWVIKISFVLAMLVGIILGNLGETHSKDRILDRLFLAEVLTSAAFVVFLVLLQTVLLFFPIRLSRNTLVHSFAFGLFFLCKTLLFVQIRMQYQTLHIASLVFEPIVLLTYCIWVFGLSPSGEAQTRTARSNWTPDEEQELKRQLSSLENLIVATSRSERPIREIPRPKNETDAVSSHNSQSPDDENY